MKRSNPTYWGWGILVASLSACGGGGGPSGGVSGDPVNSLDCSGVTAYSPANPPYITTSTAGSASTTVIMMHGKTGSPYATFLQSFYTDMAAQGYDVIAPYMPWATTTWDGTVCEAMTYIDELANAEIAKGRKVVVVGHSMGGVHSLIYGATKPPTGVVAIVTIAPGHMPHLSSGFQSTVAADVSRAESVVANGQGDVYDSFITPNNGIAVTLSTTPNIYLSYHALDQFPDMRGVLPEIELPVLWFAGDADGLTSIYYMPSLAKKITSVNSEYQLISGTHTGVVANTPSPLGSWLGGLGI